MRVQHLVDIAANHCSAPNGNFEAEGHVADHSGIGRNEIVFLHAPEF
jgi:hypothetical protein